jgi:hypothetical protein
MNFIIFPKTMVVKRLVLIICFYPLFIFTQTQIGQDIDGEEGGDFSGISISLSSNGSIVAIGAAGNNNGTGHVRVYENQSGVWTQIGQDIEGEAPGDRSGESVSLSSDGSIVAISAPFNNSFTGHVRVYENQSGVWTQIGQDIDGAANGDFFGVSVSLSSDGSIIAVGAQFNDGNGTESGHVRVYKNQSGVWTQIGQDIEGEASGDRSGGSVSLSLNGSIIAIGAQGNDGNGIDSGHVRIYEIQSGVWTQISQDIDGVATEDSFGGSVSLSSDGSVVAIGALNNDGNGIDSGHVRVYKNQSGVWTQIGQDIEGEASGDRSGVSVSLSADGSVVAIGALNNDGNGTDSGHARIYQNQAGIWTQIGQDIDGEAIDDQYGRVVSLSSDGSIVAISAMFNDGNGNGSGHVRVFNLNEILSNNQFELFKINIFPNPANTIVRIDLNSNLELILIQFYNQFGQLIKEVKQTTINVSQLASGIYYIHVLTEQGKSTKKLVIN